MSDWFTVRDSQGRSVAEVVTREYERGLIEGAESGLQPIEWVGNVVRFRANAIVRHLLDHGGIDMNAIAALGFSDADQRQFAQLIGYSVSGYGELSYTEGHESVERADAIAAAMVAERSAEGASVARSTPPPDGRDVGGQDEQAGIGFSAP